jgi:hypothetical protein
MSNGISNRNPWELNYQQISGAQGGGQNLQDILGYLFDRTKEAGWFGQDYTGDLNLSPVDGNMPIGEGQFNVGGFQQTPSGGLAEFDSTQAYNLNNLINMLTNESSSFMTGLTDNERQGYGALGGMLEGINLGGLTRGYKQNIGDISSEISGQIQGLKKGYGSGQKTSRYGNVGGGGRNLGSSSRGQYMSDIYGLQQKQQELMQGAQGGLESDFYGQVGNWMALEKAPWEGEDS